MFFTSTHPDIGRARFYHPCRYQPVRMYPPCCMGLFYSDCSHYFRKICRRNDGFAEPAIFTLETSSVFVNIPLLEREVMEQVIYLLQGTAIMGTFFCI